MGRLFFYFIGVSMKVARLIVTMLCGRNCEGCCNTYSRIISQAVPVSRPEDLEGYDMILLTGGEPMLAPDLTLDLIEAFRRHDPARKLYLYTALFTNRMPEMVGATDGIQYSLHHGATRRDAKALEMFQHLIAPTAHQKSHRLYVDTRVKEVVRIRPELWVRVQIKPWMTEEELFALQPNGLPPNETLFFWHG
jgi:pyruvate-formate lyase-activating enzyme